MLREVLPVAFESLSGSVGEFALAVHLAIDPLALIAAKSMNDTGREVVEQGHSGPNGKGSDAYEYTGRRKGNNSKSEVGRKANTTTISEKIN